MRLRKLALNDAAAAYLLPIFERYVWAPTSGAEPLPTELRRRVATAPPGATGLLARLLDETPRWRLAGDAEAALAVRLLGATRSLEALPAVLRAACDLGADDADSAVGRALREAVRDYASSRMGEMVAFAAERRGDRGVLPSWLLACDEERAVELALSFLQPEAVGDLAVQPWHAMLVSMLGARRVHRALPLLTGAIERVLHDDALADGDPAWARAVVAMASAVAQLGGELAPPMADQIREAEEIEQRRLLRLEALAAGAYARELKAASESTPRVVLAILASDPVAPVRAAVASNPHTPPDVLERLAGDVSPDVRCAVAANGQTPEAAQALLARDCEPDVRRALASCRDLYPRIMETLVRDLDVEVREQVVPVLPVWLLHEAARDPDPDVRQAVPWSSSVTVDLLELLASDPDPAVRASVAAARRRSAPATAFLPAPPPE